MATHGEIRWPSVGSFDGRLRGDSHGRRQTYRQRSRAAGAGLTTAAGRKRSRDVRDGDARLRRIASAPVGAGGWIRMIKASVPLNRPRLGRSASGLATHAGRTVL